MANNTSRPSIAKDSVSGIYRSSLTQSNKEHLSINSASKICICSPSLKPTSNSKPNGNIGSCSPKNSK